ncbi:glycosyltransferase family 2 protein [Algoriphagus mannitolivorans]|uniref:glycosyltransferase family 2 protein n=1 Tax=Algoriphagus mannitolivorans TaxID=226504 RepID=UPI00040BB50C|nr:glycosyltransferase family 2 protein [Algoriphagus mannitolivorans]
MSEKDSKRISVAMTTYNGEVYLRKQLDSILNQTKQVDEIWVGDDGSTDGTLSILEEYSQKTNLQFFTNSKNLGFVKNFEKTLLKCTGDLIFLSDQDDVWFPKKVETMVGMMGDNLLIHSDCRLIDEEGHVLKELFKGEIRTHNQAEDFLFANVVTGCTALIDRKLLQIALPFPKGVLYHDWYLALIASYQGKLAYIPQPLVDYRQHSSQDTGAGASGKNSILRNCLKRIRGIEFPAMIAIKNQLGNLLAIQGKFESDPKFHRYQQLVIKSLKDYLDHFFHLRFGAFYAHRFLGKNRSLAYRLFLQLKFSVG